MQEINLRDEHQQGVLCSIGLMAENYDPRINELVRRFTPAGIDKVREILKDPFYKKNFFDMLSHEIKDYPIEVKRGVVFELQLKLL